jgi:CheY-like chemotaxis protein
MLAIATTDPFDSATLDYLAKKTGLKIIPVLSTKKDITEAIGRHYLGGRESPRDKAKILVVEDSLAVAIIIQSALIKEGYEAVIAHDGLEGMKMAFSERPDLIICDMVMPRLDGYAMKNAVHGNPATASIPIILLTSKASSEDEQRALSAGFFDFISKPVQPLRVISRVKRALELIQDLRR